MKIEITDAWWLCESLNVDFKFTFAPEDAWGCYEEQVIEETCMLAHAEDMYKCFDPNGLGGVPFRGLLNVLRRRCLTTGGMVEHCIKLIHTYLETHEHAGTVRFPSR